MNACSVVLYCQAPLSMEFPRQEYWSGLPFSTPEGLLLQGIFPAQGSNQSLLCLLHRQADCLPLCTTWPMRESSQFHCGGISGQYCHIFMKRWKSRFVWKNLIKFQCQLMQMFKITVWPKLNMATSLCLW